MIGQSEGEFASRVLVVDREGRVTMAKRAFVFMYDAKIAEIQAGPNERNSRFLRQRNEQSVILNGRVTMFFGRGDTHLHH